MYSQIVLTAIFFFTDIQRKRDVKMHLATGCPRNIGTALLDGAQGQHWPVTSL